MHKDYEHTAPPEVQAAYKAMKALEDQQRLYVMCWFCEGCGRYVGPGDRCYCLKDE